MAKQFRAPVSQDFEIVENDEIFGTVRIRPSGILWAPKRSRSWYRVTIEEFAAFARDKGTEMDR